MASAVSAVVVGATGAIGREVVLQLLANPQVSKVTTLGRREVPLPDEAKEAAKQKLTSVCINMDNLKTEGGKAFDGADVVFCALGTIRADAGSAEQFKKVDYGYVASSAEAAKAAGVKHFSLVTAQGANPNVWASDLKLFHGLLYIQTKGRAEEAVKAQGFPRVSIFRPGMLDRNDMVRSVEAWVLKLPFLKSIKVGDVAKFMVADALAPASKPLAVFEMAEMVAAVREGRAPKA